MYMKVYEGVPDISDKICSAPLSPAPLLSLLLSALPTPSPRLSLLAPSVSRSLLSPPFSRTHFPPSSLSLLFPLPPLSPLPQSLSLSLLPLSPVSRSSPFMGISVIQIPIPILIIPIAYGGWPFAACPNPDTLSIEPDKLETPLFFLPGGLPPPGRPARADGRAGHPFLDALFL